MEQFLRIGVITQAHGIRGEVKVYPTTDSPERFKEVKRVIIQSKKGEIETEIKGVKFFKNMAIVQFACFDSPEEASKYRSTLENQIADAEKARDEMIQIGMDQAEAEEIFQRRIQEAKEESSKKAQEYIREAADIEYSLTHTAFEKQLHDIERWKEAQMEKAETAEEVAAIVKDAKG